MRILITNDDGFYSNGIAALVRELSTDNEITVWSKVCTTAQEDYIVLAPDVTDSKKCKVKCLVNDLLIGSTFRLQCTDGTSTGDLLVTITGGM